MSRFVVRYVLAAALVLAIPAQAAPPTVSSADAAAIKQAALDYIEGWYAGDAARMERAVHPDLAKRIVRNAPGEKAKLGHMGAAELIKGTAAGYGKDTPVSNQLKDVTLLDVYENAASVKVVASEWIDYLHLARWNGQWKIVNVLWEMKPQK